MREYQRIVRDIWRKVLETDGFELEDNFFNVGGSSVLMARLRAELMAELARDISIVTLYRCPTVKSLAHYLERGAVAPADCPPPRSRLPRTGGERARRLAARRMTIQNQERLDDA